MRYLLLLLLAFLTLAVAEAAVNLALLNLIIELLSE